MSIRSTVKAIIVKDGKILLNRCYGGEIGEYFSFPGGGQQQYETLQDAVVRECLEETGYAVTPVKFAAVSETIFTNEGFRERYSHSAHRVYHFFICELLNDKQEDPTEKDPGQTGTEWVAIDSINKETSLFPAEIRDNLHDILAGTAPVFLGTGYK